MSKASKIVVDNLIKDLKARPSEFSCGEHTLHDKTNGVYYWVANGVFHGGIHRPYEMGFGMVQSWRFHRALDAWKAWFVTSGKAV